LDGILCNPEWAAEFDRIASGITGGYEPLYYRWAALSLRKQAKAARTTAESLPADLVNRRFSPALVVGEFLRHRGTDGPGVYLLKDIGGLSWRKRAIYVGETPDVRHWLETCGALLPASLSEHVKLQDIAFSFLRVDDRPLTRRALKALHVRKRQPPLNHPDFSRRAA
jgi:site-specific DNA-methyltransferase (adenine-specific)